MAQLPVASRFRVRCLFALVILGFGLFILQPLSFAQQPPQRKTPARKAPAKAGVTPATSNAQPKFKGIWEPVNYSQDIQLTDVFFVTPDVGWVSGAAGTILHTRDGGKTWTAQLGGNAQSQSTPISGLRFIDRTHGWAVQYDQLLRTSDGESWKLVGPIRPIYGQMRYFLSHRMGYAFTSETNGVFAMYWPTIFHTKDGGHTWQDVFTCHGTVEIEGLTRDVGCELRGVEFLSPQMGYAMADSPGGFVWTLKTEDGGETWNIVSSPHVTDNDVIGDWFFTDESTGFLIGSDDSHGKNIIYATTDGGRNWDALINAWGGPLTAFADPEVGWSFHYRTLSYTTDGGKHWAKREIRFPANVNAFSLPRRDRAYVVGDHGMIYRYRVVPVTETIPRAIEEAAMPGFASPLPAEVGRLKHLVTALQSKLDSAGATPASGANSGFQQSASADGGGFVDSCCGDLVQNLDTTVNSFATDAPQYSSRYRNLNLVLTGLQFLNNLTGQANTLKASLKSLRQARDPRSASAALNVMRTNVDRIESSGGFQQDVSEPFPPPRPQP